MVGEGDMVPVWGDGQGIAKDVGYNGEVIATNGCGARRQCGRAMK